ncbi:MAG: hypothetical protein HOL06_02205 [Rhodospirillaceae bacterium]|nr:hypothetical protein [Rhodospirillaceae bacterium]
MFSSLPRVAASAVFAIAGTIVVTAPVKAEFLGEFKPELHGEIEIETLFNRTYNADKRHPGTSTNNFFSEFDDVVLRLGLFPQLGIVANIGFGPLEEELEPVKENPVNRHGYYKSMILYAEELFVRYASSSLIRSDYVDEIGVFGGKFNPNFGLNNGNILSENEFPGIFSEEYMEDYELKEMIGGGGNISFAHRRLGSHTLNASAFYRDNSFLQTTLISHRPQNKLAYGGVANTGKPNSFSITLEGEDISYVPGLRYKLGYRRLHKGETGGRSYDGQTVGEEEEGPRSGKGEVGWSAGLVYNKAFFLPRKTFKYPLDMKFMFEYAQFNTWNGQQSYFKEDRTYITPSLQAKYGPWKLAFIYSRRERNPIQTFTDAEREDIEDNQGIEVELWKPVGDDLYEVNLGYSFAKNWTLETSWAHMEEFEDGLGNEKDLFGVQLNYSYLF